MKMGNPKILWPENKCILHEFMPLLFHPHSFIKILKSVIKVVFNSWRPAIKLKIWDFREFSIFHKFSFFKIVGNLKPYRIDVLNVEPAVNRQPGFRRELVEQITLCKIASLRFSCSGRSSDNYSRFQKMSSTLFIEIWKCRHFLNILASPSRNWNQGFGRARSLILTQS